MAVRASQVVYDYIIPLLLILILRYPILKVKLRQRALRLQISQLCKAQPYHKIRSRNHENNNAILSWRVKLRLRVGYGQIFLSNTEAWNGME